VHGIFIYIFEVGLILILLFHMWAGLEVSVLGKYRARPVRYKKTASAGGRSRKTLSSITMIITGAIILVFLVWHVKMFKFGGAKIIGEGDHAMKDLYTVVLEAFKDPLIVAAYVIVMICLGFHLRHATWSAFQSLGLAKDETLPTLNKIAVAFAVVMTIGFCFLPLFMYLADLPPEAHATLMEGGR
jgi:succinate dehydrogenase / fumarate reductase cytochrome b subunit